MSRLPGGPIQTNRLCEAGVVLVGFTVIAAGLVFVVIGGQLTSRRIKGEFGYVDNEAAHVARVAGRVPKWFSFVVLLGWAAMITGLVLLFVL
jgi:hypothetical protein